MVVVAIVVVFVPFSSSCRQRVSSLAEHEEISTLFLPGFYNSLALWSSFLLLARQRLRTWGDQIVLFRPFGS